MRCRQLIFTSSWVQNRKIPTDYPGWLNCFRLTATCSSKMCTPEFHAEFSYWSKVSLEHAIKMIQGPISCPFSVHFSNFVSIRLDLLSTLLPQASGWYTQPLWYPRQDRCLAWCRKLEHGGWRNSSLCQCNSSWARFAESNHWNSRSSSCSESDISL